MRINAAYPTVLIIGAATMLALLRGDSWQLTTRTFNWAFALFTMIALTSFLYAHDVGYSTRAFGVFVKSAIMLFLVVQLIRTPRDVERFAWVMLAGSLATIVLSTFAFKLGVTRDVHLIGKMGWMRFVGARADPNVSAVYLVSSLPLAAYALRRFKHTAARVLICLSTLFMLMGVFLTFSRGAVFQLGFVLLAIIVRDVRNRWAHGAIFALVVSVFLLTPAYYWQRLRAVSEIFSGSYADWSIYLRATALRVAWEKFLAHPFTGLGLDNFMPRSGPDLFVRMPVHNVFLEILVGLGIFGFLAYMAMHITAIREYVRAMRVRWRPEHEWMRHLSFYLMLSLIVALIGGLFLSYAFYYVIWLPLAIGLAAGRIARRYAEPDDEPLDGPEGASPAPPARISET
jgi:O-antigen ligase